MCVHDLRNTQDIHLFEVGYSKEFSEIFQRNYQQSPIAAASVVSKIGDVHTLAMICPDEELLQSRFYREVLKPFDIRDFIGSQALRTAGRIASVHASRREAAPRYTQRDVNLFKLLSPHICRTLAISDALDIRTLHSEMLEATLDGLAAAVYLVTRERKLVYMNAAAERQIGSGNALRIRGERLFLSDPEAGAAFAKSVDDMVETEAAVHGGHSLAIRDANGAGYLATLLPLDHGRRQRIMAPFAASAAIFVQDSVPAAALPGEAFAKLYGLTGGELRVLLTVAQGLGAKEAADMLGIGEPTVRTHLQRIFSKTGTSKQAQLLQLLHSSTPPTKSGPAFDGKPPAL
jgi:DNA-binding CsgD family transcriptional regulator/PAS domain-containing protein